MTFTVSMFWIGVTCGAVGMLIVLYVAGQVMGRSDGE